MEHVKFIFISYTSELVVNTENHPVTIALMR